MPHKWLQIEGSGPIGTDDVDEVLAIFAADEIVADAAAGETQYTRSGCGSCHAGGAQAPATEGTWTRVQNERLAATGYATGEEYLIESIVNPEAYVVDGYNGGIMPGTFKDQLTAQQLANIIAYLQTQE